MKRLFYIQSPISLLVAEKIIETYAFAPEDCVIIYGRKMKPKHSKFTNILWDDFVQVYSWNFVAGIRKQNQIKKALNQFITDHLPSSFILYTSSFSDWFIQYLLKNKKCIEFNFIEEGASAFFTQAERNSIQNATLLSSRLFYYLKIGLSHTFNYCRSPFFERSMLKKSHSIYTFLEEGFQEYPNRVQIDPPFQKKESLKHIKAVFAPWYIVESGTMKKEVYFKAMYQAFNQISDLGEQVIHYKFHPQHLVKGEYLDDYHTLFSHFSDRIEFIALDNSISLENVAYSSKARFYLDVSSLAIYAKTCGSKIISYCDVLIQYDPKFATFKLPKKLHDIVFPGNLLSQGNIDDKN